MIQFISTLHEKFKDPNEYHSNVLDDIMDCLIKTKHSKNSNFDLGFYLTSDISKNKFALGGVTLLNRSEKFLVENDINDKLNFIQSESNKTQRQKRGLFNFILEKFNEDKINECYITLNDIEKFKESDDPRLNHYISLDIKGQKSRSEYLFPIYLSHTFNIEEKTINRKVLYCIIVLMSIKDKTFFTYEELKILSRTINYIVQNNFNLQIESKYIELINDLSESENFNKNDLKLSREDEKIFDALVNFFPVQNPNSLSSLPHCLLKHASLWTFNDSDKKKIYLIKNKAFESDPSTVSIISCDRSFLNTKKDKDPDDNDNKHPYLETIIKTYWILNNVPNNPFRLTADIHIITPSLKKRFINYEDFSSRHNIGDDDVLVIIPIIPHTGKANSILENIDKINIGLLVLYFDKATYPYYYNFKYIELLSHKIFENYRIWIHLIRREIRRSILNDITFALSGEENFFARALERIIENVVFDEAFLYLFDVDRDNLKLKAKAGKDSGLIDQITDPLKISIENASVLLPKEATINEKQDFVEFITKIAKSQEFATSIMSESAFFWNNSQVKNIGTGIYTLMILPICVSNNQPAGIIICINNRIIKDYDLDKKENSSLKRIAEIQGSFFSKEEKEIASIGVEVMATYIEMLNNSKVSEERLKKLGHEIPNQTQYIKETSEILRQIYNTKHDKLSPEYRHINNLFNQLDLADLTIELFTEYSNIKKISFEVIKENNEKINIRKFLSSLLGLLNTEARKYGTYVEFKLNSHSHHQDHEVSAHPFIRLAIFNLLNNAIKYSLPGSNVLVNCINGIRYYIITIKNIGIGISPSDKDKLFDNGFRGKEAQNLQYKGSGSGLYLVKKIVDAHKSEIELVGSSLLCKRNIFALKQIELLINDYHWHNPKIDFYNFINTNSNMNKPLEYFVDLCLFTAEEITTLNKLYEFQLHHSILNDEIENYDYHKKTKKLVFKNFLSLKYNHSNTFEIIRKKFISKEIYLNEFKLTLNKDIFK
jgi:signal transduction histidine kinase